MKISPPSIQRSHWKQSPLYALPGEMAVVARTIMNQALNLALNFVAASPPTPGDTLSLRRLTRN